jgi:hypothetical protein
MGFISFQDHFRVAIDESEPIRDRVWALRTCCSRISALTEVISADEVVALVAKVVGEETSIWRGNTILEKKISQAANVVGRVRRQLLYQKEQYDQMRKARKRNKKRFPVQKPFKLTDIEEVFRSL